MIYGNLGTSADFPCVILEGGSTLKNCHVYNCGVGVVMQGEGNNRIVGSTLFGNALAVDEIGSWLLVSPAFEGGVGSREVFLGELAVIDELLDRRQRPRGKRVAVGGSGVAVTNGVGVAVGPDASGGNRFETNQIALYEFKTGQGATAYDTSGVDPALDLTLVGDVDWVGGWGIDIRDGKAQGSTTAIWPTRSCRLSSMPIAARSSGISISLRSSSTQSRKASKSWRSSPM